jgi:cytochrome c551/c552
MRHFYLIFSVFLIGLILSCKVDVKTSEDFSTISFTNFDHIAALERNCMNCHQASQKLNTAIAPDLTEIKLIYLEKHDTKAEFILNMKAFINHPTVESSLMPEAIDKYGLMPKLSYKDGDLTTMIGVIYENDFSSVEWEKMWLEYKSGYTKNMGKINYIDLGMDAANSTKSTLGKNLLAALQNYGPDGAVDFCHTRAIPLTDSMSTELNISVKRVSDKPRNPLNQANAEELKYITYAKAQLKDKVKPEPGLMEYDKQIVAYYPIETNDMCLQCHGIKNEHINEKTLSKILDLYPEDLATGYQSGEIRGIFVVEMDKKPSN